MQELFWAGYTEYVSKISAYTDVYSLRKRHGSGIDLSFGSSEYWPYLKANFRKGYVSAGVWFGNDNNDTNYKKFLAHNEEIEVLLGHPLDFGLSKTKNHIIGFKEFDLYDRKTWLLAYDWLMKMALGFNAMKSCHFS